MTGHIFDIDVLLTINSKPWIIDKNNPNVPLLKISKSDFNLIKNGVYKSQKNILEYNGKTFWLPNSLNNKLKIMAKNKRINIDNIAISMQEFLNKDVIDNLDYSINFEAISDLKNKNEDIYLICSTNTERNYRTIVEKLLEKLTEEGIMIKKFYYLNEAFYNSNSDEIIFKKALICLKHLVGYEIKNEQFIDNEITKYSKLNFYDDDFDTLKLVDEINSYLGIILSKTDSGIKEVIKEDVRYDKATFIAKKIASNKYNKFTTSEVKLTLNPVVRKFNNFK
jgi:hypothetical protein